MAMNKRRLQRLYDIVKNHKDTPIATFDMRRWVCSTFCGTTYCAAGLYVLKSRQRDLRLDVLSENSSLVVNKSGDTNEQALGKHFGLCGDVVYRLFYATKATRQQFLANLKEVLNGNDLHRTST